MVDGTRETGGEQGAWTGAVLEDRYEVGLLLGKGGMGEVYKAHDRRMRRDVVVKVPHARFLADPEFHARFELEIQSLTGLQHPHIVKVWDAGVHEKTPYAVLEYLGGGSLRDRLPRHGPPSSPDEVLAWLGPVARALDHIHAQGVVHRDVKPGNVLFDQAGHVYLADFGIAKALSSLDTGVTQTGVTPGSPDYMAPESGRTTVVSGAYDQYALGAVVYEALAGDLPIRGDTPLILMTNKLTQDPPPLGQRSPHIPSRAAAVVMRALSREPEERFPSCAAFAAAFEAGLDAPSGHATGAAGALPAPTTRHAVATGASARQGTREGRAAVESRRRRRLLWPTLLIGLLATVGAGWWFVLGPGSRTAPPAARTSASAPTRDPGADGPATEREPAPGVVAIPLAILEPAEGALLSTREARVVVSAAGAPGGAEVKIGGLVATRSGDQFEATVTLPADGVHAIRAEAQGPGVTAEPAMRSVTVDTTAPVLRVTSPATSPHDTSEARVRIACVVEDASSVTVTSPDVEVTQASERGFQALVDLGEGQTRRIRLRARDAAGHVSADAVVELRRPAVEPSWTPIRTRLLEAYASGDLAAASLELAAYDEAAGPPEQVPQALRSGVSAWRAPPEVRLVSPASGSTVTQAQPELVIGWASGRDTDRLTINGQATSLRAGRGEQRVQLPRALSAGRNDVVLEVRDGATSRWRSTVTLTYEDVRVDVPSWAKVSREQIEEARRHRIPVAFSTSIAGLPEADQIRFVLVPSGRFQMGSPEGEEGHDGDEAQHEVELTRAYYMSMHEITNAQYRAMDGAHEGRWSEPRRPVETVSWDDAVRFGSWLGSHGGGGRPYRLPTEAEWERAARAGTTTPFWFGETISTSQANYDGNFTYGSGVKGVYREQTTDVGTFPANGYGLYDLHGNVWEWCQDWYDSAYYGTAGSLRDPTGPSTGEARAARGGSWFNTPWNLRSANRLRTVPSDADGYLGFRLVSPAPSR